MIWKLNRIALDCSARVRIMGILNVTPDSFYDGGRYADPGAAVERALQMVEEGAEVIDIGGESSRPAIYGLARQVSPAEECARVIPIVEQLRRRSEVWVSVDTVKAEVARQALEAGADIVNDISALRGDPQMARVIAQNRAGVVLMHGRGIPSATQLKAEGGDLLVEIKHFLGERIDAACNAGIDREAIVVDPGIGFGKSVAGNLELVARLEELADLQRPLLLGASRKSFIWRTLGLTQKESLEGSLAIAVFSVLRGTTLLRVHDIEATVRAVRMVDAVQRSSAKSSSTRQRGVICP